MPKIVVNTGSLSSLVGLRAIMHALHPSRVKWAVASARNSRGLGMLFIIKLRLSRKVAIGNFSCSSVLHALFLLGWNRGGVKLSDALV